MVRMVADIPVRMRYRWCLSCGNDICKMNVRSNDCANDRISGSKDVALKDIKDASLYNSSGDLRA
jgi:hypothetical protein